jgi:ketosteroid isomerase-like protein
MEKITTVAFLILAAVFTAFAQGGKDEQEILKINQEYNGASLKNDLAFFERVLADDYIYSGPTGRLLNRTQYLEEIRNEAAKPTYKLQEITSVEPKIKIVGNMAILTAGWTSATTPLNDAKTEPHKDTGRYTTIYEKRGGRWMITAEHVSEAQHDRKLMEQQVMKAGHAYNEMLKRNDVAAMERILADEYMYTSSEGTVTNKAQEIERHKSGRIKFEIAETTDQKVRITGNGSAVETATFRVKGTNDGKAFDETERYTTVWVWRGGRWQIVADHTSAVKQ